MFGLSKTTIMSVKGMSCGHCEKRVVDALSKVANVKSADASAPNGTVTITHSGDLDLTAAKKAVESAGYKVVEG